MWVRSQQLVSNLNPTCGSLVLGFVLNSRGNKAAANLSPTFIKQFLGFVGEIDLLRMLLMCPCKESIRAVPTIRCVIWSTHRIASLCCWEEFEPLFSCFLSCQRVLSCDADLTKRPLQSSHITTTEPCQEMRAFSFLWTSRKEQEKGHDALSLSALAEAVNGQ